MMIQQQNKPSPHMQAIATLFAAFGQAGDYQRMAVYGKMLKQFPPELLTAAVNKALLESKFLPSISEIADACEKLLEAVDDSVRVKSWDEAWAEIQKQMQDAFVYKKPVFSTPEIEQAAMAFGWIALCETQTADLPTVRAQVRRFYEDACARSKERKNNAKVLGKLVVEAVKSEPEAEQLDEFEKAYRLLYGSGQKSPVTALKTSEQGKYTNENKNRQKTANPSAREAIKRIAGGMNLSDRNGD